MMIGPLPVNFHEGLHELHKWIPGSLVELLPALATFPVLFGLVRPANVHLVLPLPLRIGSWKTKT